MIKNNFVQNPVTQNLFEHEVDAPADVRELFDSSTACDSENELNNSRRKKASQESIIFDEEYEIFFEAPLPLEKSILTLCPFCNLKIASDEHVIYNSFLNQYYSVHMECSSRFQIKDLGFKLYGLQSAPKMCQVVTQSLEPTMITRDAQVFVELKVFHPISTNPLVKLNYSTALQQRRNSEDGCVQLEFTAYERQQKLYQPKRLYLPLLEARVQANIYVFDQSNSVSQNHFEYTFFYSLKASGKVTLRSQDSLIQMKGRVESKTALEVEYETGYSINSGLFGPNSDQVVSLQSMSFILPDLLKKKELISSPIINKACAPDQIFMPVYTPKAHPTTPKIPIMNSPPMEVMASRGRLPSFNLNEEPADHSYPQKIIDEMCSWTEDITSIEQIRGYIGHFVKTQQGSRLIQKFFSVCGQSDLDVIIKEIEDQIPDLMIDPYANYLFGSLSQSCVPHQRVHILRIISPRLIEIACDKKGTHAVQALVSLISSRHEEELIENAIKDHVVRLIFDSQGTHLIKKIISRFQEDKLNFILYNILDNFIQIVNHQYGLCVLKDLMTKYKNSDKSYQILKKMLSHIEEIIQDPYGNYAIQHAMDVYGDLACAPLIERALQKIVQLSIHKYSSNVVEKCILETSYQTKKKFIVVLSKEDINLELMKNKFGSFVLQKALMASKQDRQLFLQFQSSLYKNLTHLYTPNIRQKWQDYLDNLSSRKGTQ